MKLQDRDKRAIAALAVAAFASLVVYFWPGAGAAEVVVAGPDSIVLAEKQLSRLRQVAGTRPARQRIMDTAAADLAAREKGILSSETAAQAQAQLLQTVRRLCSAQEPPVEVGQVEMGQVRLLGNDYGEVLVTVSLRCRIEQLVNLLADVTAQPELIATEELNIRAGDPKQKILGVRLTVSGVLPKRLVPERKGLAAF